MVPPAHLEHRGIRNTEVLRVMRSVPREQFVPEELRLEAYDDKPLDIGYRATISQPYIVAAMTELLELRKDHRVLEIGSGSGYQTAILAELAGEVFSIEVEPELARSAAERLARLHYDNTHVRHGDGYLGWPELAPFDRIILTAAPVEIPTALVEQLTVGGKLVAPVGSGDEQVLIVLNKSSSGDVTSSAMFPVLFVPMVRALPSRE